MEIRQSEGVVLSAMDYGEADRIVTLFTPDMGKIRAFARNGKKSRKRFGAALESFARLRLQLVPSDTLCQLRGADIVTLFPRIREGLAGIGNAAYACELVDRLAPEAHPAPRLYRLIVSYLEYLDSAPCSEHERRFYEVNLLNILGLRPSLDNCPSCGIHLYDAADIRLSESCGGIYCGGCAAGGRRIDPATLSLLGRALRTGRFGGVRFPGEALREAGEILDSIIVSQLDRPLRSLAFLRETLPFGGY